MDIVTVSERKDREAARKAAAVRGVLERLRVHVAETGNGGRFIVFGSAAAGAMRHGSDFDVVVDFPPELEVQAWTAVEDACEDADIPADIRSVSTTEPSFIEKIMARTVEVIG